MTDLAAVEVVDLDGARVRLGDVVDRPTILELVRYYGCAPCRAHLKSLARHHARIVESGGAVLAAGPAADFQARALQPDLPFPLLLDPERRIAGAAGMRERRAASVLLDPRGWVRWARGLTRGGRQGAVTSLDTLPAIFVLDSSGVVHWSHLGTTIGDYPPLETTLDRLAEVLERDGDPKPDRRS